ncbi:glycosyltransferase family 2 protein [Sphingomonas hankookensis]|nr:glycosyltransferase family 2 protein [Sphingomonas hankookensis]
MRISVVTVCFNAAATIGDTLASVAAQHGVEVEHIIIDGGSRDATMDVVRRYPHVAVAISEPDRGAYDAMNKGLARATGDYVGFLNADDFLCEPDALAAIAAAAGAIQADAVIAGVTMVDGETPDKVQRYYGIRNYRPWMLGFGHMPPHPTFYARTTLLGEAGGFDDRFRIAGDFDLILRLFRKGPLRLARVDRALVGFRHGGLSTDGLRAKATLNAEIERALRAAGLRGVKLRAMLRYLLKLPQFLMRPAKFAGRAAFASQVVSAPQDRATPC